MILKKINWYGVGSILFGIFCAEPLNLDSIISGLVFILLGVTLITHSMLEDDY